VTAAPIGAPAAICVARQPTGAFQGRFQARFEGGDRRNLLVPRRAGEAHFYEVSCRSR
jgi:hypothetical protein